MLSKSVQLVFNNPHDMDENNEVDRTLWCGNLADEITEECLYELFLQAGPLDKVKLVTDRETNKPKYAFITFCHAESVPYTIDLMNGLQLYNKPLRLQTRPGSRHNAQGPAPGAAMSQMLQAQPVHNDMSRSMSAPDHIQNFAANDMYGQNSLIMQMNQSSAQNSLIMQMNQYGSGLTNPMAAQSLLSSGNHFATKEAQRQRLIQQQQQAVHQQQLMQQQKERAAWMIMQQQQQQMAWNSNRQSHWY